MHQNTALCGNGLKKTGLGHRSYKYCTFFFLLKLSISLMGFCILLKLSISPMRFYILLKLSISPMGFYILLKLSISPMGFYILLKLSISPMGFYWSNDTHKILSPENVHPQISFFLCLFFNWVVRPCLFIIQ